MTRSKSSSCFRRKFETLEQKMLMAVDIGLDHGAFRDAMVLHVVGTENGDAISVAEGYVTGRGGVRVPTLTATVRDYNSNALLLQKTFYKADVDRILVEALGSGDTVQITTNTPATIYGGNGGDALVGGSGPDTIYGGGPDGKDTGDNLIWGGDGNDTLHGGDRTDTMYGDAGHDHLYSGGSVFGDRDADERRGNADRLYGGSGDDHLTGERSGGIDPTFLFGEAGSDRLVANAQYGSTLDGGGNDDVLIASESGDDRLFGNSGNDLIDAYSTTGNKVIDGGPGNDLLEGSFGNDVIYGGSGDDAIYAGAGDDFLYGEDGNDTLEGQAGDDFCQGDAGNDLVVGGEGWDELWGDVDLNYDYSDTPDGDDTIYFDMLDLVDGWWGSILYPTAPTVVEGRYAGYGVYRG